MKSKPTNPWAALDSMMRYSIEPTGPEWFTAQQFAKRYGYSQQHSHKVLEGMVEAGKVEKWTGTLAGARRRGCKYRPAH